MQLDLRSVHVFKPLPKKPGQFYLAETNPAQVLIHDDQRLYIQHGAVFSGPNSRPLKEKEIPAWFHEEVVKLSPETLASLKYTPPARKAA